MASTTTASTHFFVVGSGTGELNVSPFGSTGVLTVQLGLTTVATTFTPALGVWHHYAVTITAAGAVIIYVNGTQVATGTGTLLGQASPFLYFGRWMDSTPQNQLAGGLSNIEVTNTALPAYSVAQMFAGNGCASSLPFALSFRSASSACRACSARAHPARAAAAPVPRRRRGRSSTAC